MTNFIEIFLNIASDFCGLHGELAKARQARKQEVADFSAGVRQTLSTKQPLCAGKKIRIAAFAIAATAGSAPAYAGWDKFMGKCLLEVGGSRLIDGPCQVELFSADAEGRKVHPGLKSGTFSIETREGGDLLYSAYVEVIGPSKAAAWWSEEKGQSPGQHDPQGVLTRQGACWTNKQVKICAWK